MVGGWYGNLSNAGLEPGGSTSGLKQTEAYRRTYARLAQRISVLRGRRPDQWCNEGGEAEDIDDRPVADGVPHAPTAYHPSGDHGTLRSSGRGAGTRR
jgi:hypothetical protein